MTKQKSGVAIGLITRGTVSIKWMQHMTKVMRMLPIGMIWELIVVEDDSGWAHNRTKVVEKAKERGYEWLFFVDDDVFVPDDVLQRMLSHGKDIVTGIYWTKSENSVPVIFEKMGAGPMFKFPIDKLFEVEGSGLGCALINMKVFDDFDKARIPYFKENWVMTLDNGNNIKCPIGEDHYFYYHAKKLGYSVWADSGVLCDHYDVNTKIFYPSPETVRELTGEKLTEIGRDDIIKKHSVQLGRDSSKKTISFVNFTANPFCGNELEKRPLGGAETDVIHLAKMFAKEYDFNVHVFCNCPSPGVYDGVVYHDIVKDIYELKSLNSDLLISSRNTDIFNRVDFKKDFNAKKVALWTHDMVGDPVYRNFENAYKHLDYVFALTEWHKKSILDYYPFVEEDKIFVARNGVHTPDFSGAESAERVSGRMIYSSTPYRGLEILAEVFPEIKKRVPNANLKVFSSMKVYGSEYNDEEFSGLYNSLKNMDGVEYIGSVKQKELHSEMLKAELLVYPNLFPETFCITAAETITAGTPIVTSNYAALSEVVTDDVGIKIDGNPHSDEYKKQFVEAVVELLTNKNKWRDMHNACLKKDFSWYTVADTWIQKFFPEQSKQKVVEEIKSDVDSIVKAGNVNTPDYWDKVYSNEISAGHDRVRKEEFEYILSQISNDDNLLDIGCGTGAFTRYIRANRPSIEIWGSDFSMKAIDYCRGLDKTIFYANHPVMNDEFEEKYFSVITVNHVIEHLDNPEEMIERVRKLLKPNGKLILAIPLNDDEWHEHLKIWHLNDIEELLRPFNCDYTVKTVFEQDRRYEDGRKFQSAVVTINFNEE